MSKNKFYIRNAGTAIATVAIAGSLALSPAIAGFAVSGNETAPSSDSAQSNASAPRLSIRPDKIPARENTQYSEVIATLEGGNLQSGDKIVFSFDNGVKTQTLYASTGYDGVSISAEWFYHFPGKLAPGVHKITATVNGKTIEATFTIEAPTSEAPSAPAPTPQPPATKPEAPTKSDPSAEQEESDPQDAQDSEPDTSTDDSQDQSDSDTQAADLNVKLSKLIAKKGETITITAEGGTVGNKAVLDIDGKQVGSAPVKLVDGKPKAVFQYKVPADLKDGQHRVHVATDNAEGFMSLDTRGSVEPVKPTEPPKPNKPETTTPVKETPKPAPATSELKLTTPKNTVNISEDVRYEASGMGFDDYNVFYVDGVAITDPEQPIKQGENIINPFTYAFPRGTKAGEHIIGVTSSAKKNHEKGDAGVRYAEVKVNVTAPDASAQPVSPYKLEISKDTVKQGETVHIKGSNLPGGSHIHLQVNGKFCFHGDLDDNQTVAECDYKVAPDAKLGDYKVTLETQGKSAQGIFTVVAAEKPKAETPKTEAPKTEEPKVETPKTEAPKTEEPKVETPKTEAPKTEEPKVETPKTEEPKVETPKVETPKTEEPKAETPKVEQPKTEAPKTETPKSEAPKADAPKTETPKTEEPKVETPKAETPKVEKPKVETPKSEAPKADAPKTEAPKTEVPKAEAPKAEAPKPAAPKTDPATSAVTDKSSYGADDEIHYSFSGLTPNSKVRLELHTTTYPLGEFVADSEGKLTGSVKIPTGVEAGAHHLVAIDATGKTASAAIEVLAKASTQQNTNSSAVKPEQTAPQAAEAKTPDAAAVSSDAKQTLAATGTETSAVAVGAAVIALFAGAVTALRRRRS